MSSDDSWSTESESSDSNELTSNEDKGLKAGVKTAIDLRDFDQQMAEEEEYIRKNIRRRPDTHGSLLFAHERDGGSRVSQWGGKNSGRTAEVGLLSMKSHASINENNLDVGRARVACVIDSNQFGLEGDAKAVSAGLRLGPAKVNASALGVGYEAGVGRNTGGFVRGHVASVGTSVGPVGVTAGVGFDTGARAGADGVEFKALGCGGMIDKNQGIGISLFGTTIKFKPW